jgi:tetrahydromethanopterin S-methyltransferase subunit G
MAIMLATTYQAFKAAGVPDEDAVAAPEELAAYENPFVGIENQLASDGRLDCVEDRLDWMENRLDHIESRLAAVQSKVAALAGEVVALAGKSILLTWPAGINRAAAIAIVGALLRGRGSL